MRALACVRAVVVHRRFSHALWFLSLSLPPHFCSLTHSLDLEDRVTIDVEGRSLGSRHVARGEKVKLTTPSRVLYLEDFTLSVYTDVIANLFPSIYMFMLFICAFLCFLFVHHRLFLKVPMGCCHGLKTFPRMNLEFYISYAGKSSYFLPLALSPAGAACAMLPFRFPHSHLVRTKVQRCTDYT